MERPKPMVNASPEPGTKAPAGGRRLPLLACLAAGLLGACSYLPEMPSMPSMPALPGPDIFASPRQIRGHLVDDEDLRQLTVGVSTRSDVEALLGSPSASGTFDDSEWYYIGGITRMRPARRQAVDDQQVLLVRFDQGGIVRELRRLGPDDGREVQAVSRITPSPGNERTLLQQLFGNIGRVGPGLGQQPTGPGGPSPSGR